MRRGTEDRAGAVEKTELIGVDMARDWQMHSVVEGWASARLMRGCRESLRGKGKLEEGPPKTREQTRGAPGQVEGEERVRVVLEKATGSMAANLEEVEVLLLARASDWPGDAERLQSDEIGCGFSADRRGSRGMSDKLAFGSNRCGVGAGRGGGLKSGGSGGTGGGRALSRWLRGGRGGTGGADMVGGWIYRAGKSRRYRWRHVIGYRSGRGQRRDAEERTVTDSCCAE